MAGHTHDEYQFAIAVLVSRDKITPMKNNYRSYSITVVFLLHDKIPR